MSDEGFFIWLKAAYALKIAKKGIEDDVRKTIEDEHKKYREGSLSKEQLETEEKCTKCLIQNVIFCNAKGICEKRDGKCVFHCTPELQERQCPKNICNRFSVFIWKNHKHKKPSWRNTDSTKWCENSWEVAKCFMQKEGYSEANSAHETDLNGLLSVIHNHKCFTKKYDQQLCGQARKEINRVRHSSNLSLTEEELKHLLDILFKFLDSCHNEKSDRAKEKIERLKSQPIHNFEELEWLLQPRDDLTAKTHDLLGKVVKALTQVDKASNTFLENINKKMEEMKKRDGNQEDSDYLTKKKALKEDLLFFNQKHHSTLPMSPFYEKRDTPLLGFYVPPSIVLVDDSSRKSGHPENKFQISTLKDIFKTRSGQIYVTSEAGLGKTAFCTRMVVAWCHAWDKTQKADKCYEGFLEDLSAMKNFDFLFFVRLRDSLPDQCELDEMIRHQIIQNLGRQKQYDDGFLENILSKEACIILLDGLDEWTHPPEKEQCKTANDIPHRKTRCNCTIISTTRTWKFCMLNLSRNEIDLHAKLSELREQTSKQLVQNAISAFYPKERSVAQRSHANFQEKFKNFNIGRLRAIPLILMFLTCLWTEGKSIGESLCAVYSNIIGLLVQRAEQKKTRTEQKKTQSEKRTLIKTDNESHDIPRAIASNTVCLQHVNLLHDIGHLAFDTLFEENGQSSLVFSKAKTEQFPGVDLKFCLDAGILTESSEKTLVKQEHEKLSFAHKTFHEFFAALYFSQVSDVSTMKNTLFGVCNDVLSILACSDFFVFLAGLSPDRAQTLTDGLGRVISNSPSTKNYRKDTGSWNYFVGYNYRIKRLQSLFVSCNIESLNNKHNRIPFHLEDFVIDSDCNDEQYLSVLQALMVDNRSCIKSVKVRDIKTKEQFQRTLAKVSSTKVVNGIEKIDLKCEIDDTSLTNLLEGAESTLKCFVIKGGRWFGNKWVHNKNITLSNKFHQIIWKVSGLQGLYLRTITVTHGQLEELANSIFKRLTIEHLGLSFIKCSKHGSSCSGVPLDLSTHGQLKMLELAEVPLSSIQLNTRELEVCYVGDFRSKDTLDTVFESLKQAPKLHVFCCGFLERQSDIENMLRCVPEFHNLQHIWLVNLSLEDDALHKCDHLQHVENIYLMNINLKSTLLDQLREKLEFVTHAVKVSLSQCDVQPKADFEIWKSKIRESDNFIILQDDEATEQFLFKTCELV